MRHFRYLQGWPAAMVLAGLVLCLGPVGGGSGLIHSAVAYSPEDDDDSGSPTVTVTTTVGPACEGGGVQFEFEVCNTGDTDLSDVVVGDTLPPGLLFSEGSITGVDANGDPIGVGLCEAEEEVGECPCEGGVTFLRLRYNGPDGVHVTVEDKNDIIFDAILNDGDTFELHGSRPNGKFRKNNLIFHVDDEDTVIHVSCSQPIGVGFVFGPFTIEAFASRNAGMFDEPCVPPPPSCPCEGGVTSLTLRFNGPDGTPVTVEEHRIVVFSEILNDGDVFVLNGSRPNGRFRGNNLVLNANDEDTTIHVSCSQPIGVGYVYGPFTVEAFSSRNGGTFDAPCDGSEPGGDDHGDEHEGSHGNHCRGQTIEICLDAPIPPGECVIITFVATFSNALCNEVVVTGTIPPSDDDEGCSPGFWKNHHDHWGPTGFGTCDDFDTVFGVDVFHPDQSLEEVLNLGGGGLNALGRHAVAGLLNAAHPEVDYALTPAEVIALVQQAVGPGGDIEAAKDQLASLNELDCPLGGEDDCDHPDEPDEPETTSASDAICLDDFLGELLDCVCAPPEPTGACCLADGTCIEVMLEGNCAASGGTYEGDGTTCTPNPCPQPPVGACCLSDGSCVDGTDANDCVAFGGVYQGDATTCAAAQCPQPPTGACCMGDGSCVESAEASCVAFGGLYQGDGTSCTPNPCPVPTGACCFSDGTCTEGTQADCDAAGGLYDGHGTTCTPNPCCQPGGGDPFDVGSFCGLDPAECDPFVIEACILDFEDYIFGLLLDAEDQFLLDRCQVCCPPDDIFCDCLIPE